MNLKTKTFMKKNISLFILLFILIFTFHQIRDLFKYTGASISKNDITEIEVLTDENLKEMENTGKIVFKNKTMTVADPKKYIEYVKKEYYVIEIDSKKYYIRIYVHYYITALKNNLIYLIALLSIVLITGKKRIKNFIKSAWAPDFKKQDKK